MDSFHFSDAVSLAAILCRGTARDPFAGIQGIVLARTFGKWENPSIILNSTMIFSGGGTHGKAIDVLELGAINLHEKHCWPVIFIRMRKGDWDAAQLWVGQYRFTEPMRTQFPFHVYEGLRNLLLQFTGTSVQCWTKPGAFVDPEETEVIALYATTPYGVSRLKAKNLGVGVKRFEAVNRGLVIEKGNGRRIDITPESIGKLMKL